jgi:hypothetical protein
VRLRRLIGLLATLGVLLHAGFLVRHNTSALRSALDHRSLAVALGFICHSGEMVAEASVPDLPQVPQPTGQKGECPICAGQAAASAILADPIVVLGGLRIDAPRVRIVGQTLVVRRVAVRPPTRGPPSLA